MRTLLALLLWCSRNERRAFPHSATHPKHPSAPIRRCRGPHCPFTTHHQMNLLDDAPVVRLHVRRPSHPLRQARLRQRRAGDHGRCHRSRGDRPLAAPAVAPGRSHGEPTNGQQPPAGEAIVAQRACDGVVGEGGEREFERAGGEGGGRQGGGPPRHGRTGPGGGGAVVVAPRKERRKARVPARGEVDSWLRQRWPTRLSLDTQPGEHRWEPPTRQQPRRRVRVVHNATHFGRQRGAEDQ